MRWKLTRVETVEVLEADLGAVVELDVVEFGVDLEGVWHVATRQIPEIG